MNPADTYTIQGFISTGRSNDVSYHYSSILELLDEDIYISAHNIFHDYKDELLDESVDVTLSDSEYYDYLYQPRRLAYKLYGYTDLYFVLMILNDICDVKDFNFKKVKVLHPDSIGILSRVINAEEYYINKNRSYISEIEEE